MTQDIRTIRIATQGPAGPPGGPASVFSVASQAAMLALAAHQGDIAVRNDINASFVLAAADPTQLGSWTELLSSGGGAVSSVAGRTGDVVLAAGDISALAASATTDTTNAGNISSGTLSNARLSGVALTANNLSDLGNAGSARGNLGLGALATLGVGSGLTSGGGTLSANVISVVGRTGAVTLAQADVSGITTADTPSFKGLTLTGATNANLINGSGYSLTGADAHSLLDYSGTLNTTGNADVIALRITDTSHGGGTRLLNLYAGAGGSTSKFSVTPLGAVTAASGVVAASFGTASDAGGYLQFGSKAYISGSATDGAITLLDNGGTGNVRFQFGGTTSSFPAIKRNGAGIDLRLADDSAYASVTAQQFTANANITFSGATQANTNGGYFALRSGNSILSSPATASWQLGAADAAAPIAQTLQAQNVAAGNGNTAAATMTVQGSLSNGSGGGGDIVFKTTQSAAAAGSQNSGAAALTLKGGTQGAEFGGTAKLKTYTVATLPAGALGMMACASDGDAGLAWGATVVNSGSGATPYHVWHNGTNWTVVGK